MTKNDDRLFQGYRYKIIDGDRTLLEGTTNQAGETGFVTTERARVIESFKTIMREDQKITENWADYINRMEQSHDGPSSDPMPAQYVEQFEEEA